MFDIVNRQLIVSGRSKRVYKIDDARCYIELVASLRSFTYAREEVVTGSDVVRLDFYEMAAAKLTQAGINHAFVERVGPAAYLAKLCSDPPFEVIVKNLAAGSTLRKYPGLFQENHRFVQPVVKFDYRTDPEDQCLADDYLREYGHNPARWKRLALDVNRVLVEWLAPRTLVDICFIIGIDPGGDECVLSEVSPDCMRLRSPEGESLDKDLFRHGLSGAALVAVWSELVASLR